MVSLLLQPVQVGLEVAFEVASAEEIAVGFEAASVAIEVDLAAEEEALDTKVVVALAEEVGMAVALVTAQHHPLTHPQDLVEVVVASVVVPKALQVAL